MLPPAILAGCSAGRFAYRSQAEIPEGPGMLSGAQGGFVLRSQGGTNEAAARDASTHAAADYREFLEFREFTRWRDAQRDSAEYREFQDWREWKALRSRNAPRAH